MERNIPVDTVLWRRIKLQADKIYKKPSAYKSGFIVKKYKEEGGTFLHKKNANEGLSRWFAEEWKNQHGKTGYAHANDVYRPSKKLLQKLQKPGMN